MVRFGHCGLPAIEPGIDIGDFLVLEPVGDAPQREEALAGEVCPHQFFETCALCAMLTSAPQPIERLSDKTLIRNTILFPDLGSHLVGPLECGRCRSVE